MSDLRQAVQDYVAVRRALGFKLDRPGDLLAQFAEFATSRGERAVTTECALAWAMLPTGADPSWWGVRLAAVRPFARWLVTFDGRSEVPPSDLLPARSRRAEPYPYGDADVVALLHAARSILPPLRAATYETLIGLLAVTGMRVGEAIALDDADVDLPEGILLIRHAKFESSRQLVVHPSTLDALAEYRSTRRRLCPRPKSPAFFISSVGTRLIYNNVGSCFHQLTVRAGLEPRSGRCRPRIHDLRHRFAVETLLRWYRDGDDVAARMPQLSTYLGHASPQGTYWYLRAEPRLLALAAERLEPAPEVLR